MLDITCLCHGWTGEGPNRVVWGPGKQLTGRESAFQPLVAAYMALEGHVDITPEAAQRMRDHYHETGERLGVDDVDGSGADGRILVSDVEAVVGDATGHDEGEDSEDAEADDLETLGGGEEE